MAQYTANEYAIDSHEINETGVISRAAAISANQASAKFRWRSAGASTYTEISISGSQNTCTIPANTFPGSNIEWQVVVTSDDGIAGTASAWYTLGTTDAISTAEVFSPKSAYIDGEQDNTFTWNHIISTGSTQTAFSLQRSTDGGSNWTTFASGVTSETSYVVSADTLPGGQLQWRVRTSNADGVAGSWSDPATIVVRASPDAPSISSVNTKPRPTVQWQSAEQQAFEIEVDGYYQSGPIFGTQKTFRVPMYLPDGMITVRLRIQSALGIWSGWATASTTIANTPNGTLVLTAESYNNGVLLSWSANNHDIYYVYRDGTLIGKTAESEFYDGLAVGEHLYIVRGVVASTDYYTVNDTQVSGISSCKYAAIAPIDSLAWLTLKYNIGNAPEHTESNAPVVAYNHFAGNALPVADVSEFRTNAHLLRYAFNSRVPKDELLSMLGKEVVVKDNRGDIAIGVLDSVPVTLMRRYIAVELNLTATAQIEVQYD